MHHSRHTHRVAFAVLLTMLCALLAGLPPRRAEAQSPVLPSFCYNQRWRPADWKLKDHALFRYDGYYYVVAIQVPTRPDQQEGKAFAYARTRDFCNWEDLGPVLGVGTEGSPDEWQIWAPHIVSFGATWYMYYTGANRNVAQTIMLATSTNPADPASWTRRGPVFTPTHRDAYYPGAHTWSDARDPMVLYDWAMNQYVMYYTGVAQQGCANNLPVCGIVGAATAAHIGGPWKDIGPVLRLETPGVPESPYVVSPGLGGAYYLFFNHAVVGGGGQQLVVSGSALGPWSAPERFLPGWASDFFQASGGWLMSYLGNYEVGVTPLVWDTRTSPARPRPAFERRFYLPTMLGSARN
jgi:hypothetical protein